MDPLNYNSYNIVLPPVHKVMLPPPTQIWDYRMQYNNNSNYAGFYETPMTTPSPQEPPIQASQPVPVQTQDLAATTKVKKPRRKRQCPDCQMWFSNLSTHRAIHLNPENRPYLCQICGRGFSRSNDLFRHGKRHWKEMGDDKGAFKCPFNTALHPHLQQGVNEPQQVPCHPTGVFSRCDTYKNHLKALHFDYPQGTKKKDRSGVCGNCKNCGKKFNNVNEWLDLHVETGECGFR
jgi:uncharacterized Zn-finger protein